MGFPLFDSCQYRFPVRWLEGFFHHLDKLPADYGLATANHLRQGWRHVITFTAFVSSSFDNVVAESLQRIHPFLFRKSCEFQILELAFPDMSVDSCKARKQGINALLPIGIG